MTDRILRARAVFVRPGARSGELLDGGGLWLRGGRIVRTLGSRGAVTRAARRAGCAVRDLGDVLVFPGLVNAHAHLELTGLAGRTRPGRSFGAWVAQVLELRAARGPDQLARDAAEGAERLLRGGTTAVGDVDTTGAGERGLARARIRSVLFRELLDAHDPARTAGELDRVRRALPRRVLRSEGVAPHAPFTASPKLLAGIAAIARRRGLQVSVHWAETPEEVEWLRSGTGPLAGILGASPGRPGLDLLEDAGLLGPRLTLVHGNHPRRGDAARIAAAGATLVHCPGTHAWFGRERFDLARFARAGVRLALGTDSAASNDRFDLRAELRRLREAHPAVAPEAAFDMATLGSARALGLEGEVGDLRAGARADLVAFEVPSTGFPGSSGSAGSPGSPRGALEALTSERLAVAAVWIGGRRVPAESATG